MKVFFHEAFYQVYTSDPAAAHGRMEAAVKVIGPEVNFLTPEPAGEREISAVHTDDHISWVRRDGLYDIASLAAGAAVQTADMGLTEPCFGVLRPPGHHASAGSAWGFCYFNNMAIAITSLKHREKIDTAYILDIDLHYGDGTVNILGADDSVVVHNLECNDRAAYLDEIETAMSACSADIIGISAGFDNHARDWGGLLQTDDYTMIGQTVKAAADRCGGGCFGILEGGYNHDVLGENILALIRGMR